MVLSLSSGVIDIKLEMADAEEVLLPMIGRSGCSGSSLAMTVSGAAEDIKKGSQAVVMAATVGAASVVVESQYYWNPKNKPSIPPLQTWLSSPPAPQLRLR